MQSIASVRLVPVALVLVVLTALCAFVGSVPAHRGLSTVRAASSACPSDDSGLKLPHGFCATIFADRIGHARHLVVAPNNVVYINTWSGDYYPAGEAVHEGGFLVALQDKSGTGKADVIERFGGTLQDGSHGGTGIALYKGSLYAEVNDRIIRYKLASNGLVPTDPPVTVVSGLPLGVDHPMHPFYISDDGMLYVDVATATNACQLKNRTLHSPGVDPCKELEARGGIWRYDAQKANQTFSPSERYATGIRNAEGFGVDKAGNRVYITQHGRDQLHANWPEIYKPEEEATLPSEEVLLLTKGSDYGWPECYYDPGLKRLVLSPEYGGYGNKPGVCSTKTGPA
jgi:glucose/arabinose dehydrogenase